MNHWADRPSEEQRLLNPAFCSVLLWHAAHGYAMESHSRASMPFEESFLVMPMVLHRETRDSLPRNAVTSLASWINTYPLARATIADRGQLLVPFTKEALYFGGVYGLLRFPYGRLQANADWRTKIRRILDDSSDEVRLCNKRAEFVGKWFARTGGPETVLAFLGVRP
jgi:hypothetical protein